MLRVLLIVGVAAAACGLTLGAVRVVTLERSELEAVSPWRPLEPTAVDGGRTEPHREILRAELQAGETVAFELCARDQLRPADWAGEVELVVWHPEDQSVVLRAPIDEALLARALRSQQGSCVVFAQATELQRGGVFAVEAVWPGRELSEAVRNIPLRARILAHPVLSMNDRWLVVLALVGAVLVALGLLGLGRVRDDEDEAPATRPGSASTLLRVGAGVALFVGVLVGVGFVPLWGATSDLGRGVVLATAQIALAVMLVAPRGRRGVTTASLGLLRPQRARWLVPAAPLVGVLVWVAGRWIVGIVPSTAESPIEAIVAWPSGFLAVSLAGVLVPLAEEIFFRGFVFGLLHKSYGGVIAFVTTVALFALAHLPQVWGAWGGFAAIILTGTVLTALRQLTRSTVAPALAHLFHNGAISLMAVAYTLAA